MNTSRWLAFLAALILAAGVARQSWSPIPRSAAAWYRSTPLSISQSDRNLTGASNRALTHADVWNGPAGNPLWTRQDPAAGASRLKREVIAWSAVARRSPAQSWWLRQGPVLTGTQLDSALWTAPTRAPPLSMWAAASPAFGID